MSRSISAITASLLLGLLQVSPAGAQNLLLNPGFSNSTANWGVSGTGTLSWSMLDANAQAGSGSAMLINDSATASQGASVMQCVPMLAGAAYYFSGKAMVPSGATQTLSNPTRVSIRFHTEIDCSDSSSGPITIGASVSQFDTWQISGPVLRVAPPGTLAVQVRGLLSKVAAGGTAVAHFDDFAAVPDTLLIAGFE